jgi:threonine dehydratase
MRGARIVALEFAEQVPELDAMLVAVGGGGLLAGVLAALRSTMIRAVGVEPSTARCLGAALEAGAPVDVEVSGAAVDSLAPRRVGRLGFDAAVAYGVHRVEVSNDAIRRAQLVAWEELRIGLEGGGATALAALLSGTYQPSDGETVGVICSGGNVDLAHLRKP